MRKYWFVYRTSLHRFIEYRGELAIDAVGKVLIPISVQYLLWRAITGSAADGKIAGYDFPSLFQYSVFSILIFNLINTDFVEREIARSIREGDLNKFLSKPVDFALYHFMMFVADCTPVMSAGVIVYALSALFGAVAASLVHFIFGALMIFVAMIVAFHLAFLIALLAFWMDEIWTLTTMKNLTLWFLTGQLIPLDMFPDSAQRILKFLPFGYLSFFPAKIFTGSLAVDEILFGFAVVCSWAMLLYLSARLFWNYALHKYGAFGG